MFFISWKVSYLPPAVSSNCYFIKKKNSLGRTAVQAGLRSKVRESQAYSWAGPVLGHSVQKFHSGRAPNWPGILLWPLPGHVERPLHLL